MDHTIKHLEHPAPSLGASSRTRPPRLATLPNPTAEAIRSLRRKERLIVRMIRLLQDFEAAAVDPTPMLCAQCPRAKAPAHAPVAA